MKSKKFWIVLILILAAAGVGAPYLFRATEASAKVSLLSAQAKRTDVSVRLQASGVLDSSSSLNINAPRTRYQRKLVTLIDEGKVVRKGDVLAIFDTSQMEERLEVLENSGLHARYRDTEMSFQISVNERVAMHKSKVENEKISQITYESMEFAPEMERKKALIRLNQATADVKIAENRIRQEEQRRDIQLRNIQEQIEQNRRDIEKLKEDIASFTVKSPADGIVVYPKIKIAGAERKVQIGDSLYWDQLFLTIPNLFEMIARVEVDEKDIRKIREGLECRITLEAFKDDAFTGNISKIERLAQIKSNNPFIKIFNVEMKINEQDIEKLRPGMNARAVIKTGSYKDAVVLPIEFVLKDGAQYYVYVLKDGEIKTENVDVTDSTEKLAILKAEPSLPALKPDANLKKLMSSNVKISNPVLVPVNVESN